MGLRTILQYYLLYLAVADLIFFFLLVVRGKHVVSIRPTLNQTLCTGFIFRRPGLGDEDRLMHSGCNS